MQLYGFNCTFMELKYTHSHHTGCMPTVLIVPLWNWNFGCRQRPRPNKVRFNCTFMELKSHKFCSLRSSFGGFNCTFMELKYWSEEKADKTKRVLIVPLWNWNMHGYSLLRICQSFNCTFMELKSRCGLVLICSSCVLIVPLWNWNYYADAMWHSIFAF